MCNETIKEKYIELNEIQKQINDFQKIFNVITAIPLKKFQLNYKTYCYIQSSYATREIGFICDKNTTLYDIIINFRDNKLIGDEIKKIEEKTNKVAEELCITLDFTKCIPFSILAKHAESINTIFKRRIEYYIYCKYQDLGKLQRELITKLNIPQTPLFISPLTTRVSSILCSKHGTDYFGFEVKTVEILCTIYKRISIEGIGKKGQDEIKKLKESYDINSLINNYIKPFI